MNIVYKLTNLDRESGRRFYVGSKTECFIEKINGVDRIVSTKTGLPYYGSSTCPLMKADMAEGHRFSAEVLEEVTNKKNLLSAEDAWIVELNAVESEDYYNIAYARVGGHMVDQTAAYNMYGETIVDYGKAVSSLNKRNNTAARYGYSNMGLFCLFLKEQFDSGKGSAEIASDLGWERHAPARYIKPYDMDKCKREWESQEEEVRKSIRQLIAEGVSAKKIAELKGLEIPTVCLYIGDYSKVYRKSYLVAQRRGETKEELEVKITKMVVDEEKGFNEVSRELMINEASVKRYFLRCIRRNLKDVELI